MMKNLNNIINMPTIVYWTMNSQEQIIPFDEEFLDGHIKMFRLPDDILPSEEDTKIMWSLKPQVRPKCRVMGKIMNMKLYSQTYLHDYKFSGLNHPCLDELPEVFQKYFDYTHILLII
uniref:Uncharacterized protein n=1 Tax=Pithovirus LCPAC101 TaxID=2506586 RepID=A0A481Z2Q0_9VIRU|nr:MAG: hypothetical protein LCPAC101_02880 [Pithovirus LCPAC101]